MASGSSWSSLVCSHITPVSAPVFLWLLLCVYLKCPPAFFYKGTCPGIRTHLDNPGWPHREIFNLFMSAKTLFSNNLILGLLQVWGKIYGQYFGGHHSTTKLSIRFIKKSNHRITPASWQHPIQNKGLLSETLPRNHLRQTQILSFLKPSSRHQTAPYSVYSPSLN